MFDEQIIDRIYEAAAIPELWPTTLNEIAQSADGDGGVLFTMNRDQIRWTTSPDLYDIFDEFVRDGWAAKNPRPPRLAAANHAGFVRDNDFFTAEEMDADPVYGYYRRKGLGFTAGTMINAPSGDTLVFSFERAFSKGHVSLDVVKQFDALRPHLARSALMSARLGLQRARAMTETLQSVGLPAAVLRGSGTISAVNSLFEGLMPSLVQDRWQRVTLANLSADALLADALARQATSSHGAFTSSIPVPAGRDCLPVIFHLLPVRGAANDIFAQATSLLVATLVNSAAVPSAGVLQGLFDLTPAEARVARGIGDAQTIEAIALSGGVSIETVRSQLKAVLSKTGLSRSKN